jgi:hypothetical protein
VHLEDVATGYIQEALERQFRSQPRNTFEERATIMSTYYYFNTSAEVAAILRDGFSHEYKNKTTGISGVYVADAPGDPNYSDHRLLEITLPPEISISQFEIFSNTLKEGVCWRALLIPAGLFNECAEIRPVPKTAWEQRWRQWNEQWIDSQIRRLIERMVERGLAEVVKDSEGKPIYRNGELAYRLRDKSEGFKRQLDMLLEDL